MSGWTDAGDDRAPAGAQPERTELAWVRTGLSCAGLAALALRVADRPADLAVVLVVGMVVALPGLLAAWWRVRDLRDSGVPPAPRPSAVALLAGSIVAVDLAVLVRLVG